MKSTTTTPPFPNYTNLSAAYQQIAAYGVYSNDGNGSLTLNGLNVEIGRAHV